MAETRSEWAMRLTNLFGGMEDQLEEMQGRLVEGVDVIAGELSSELAQQVLRAAAELMNARATMLRLVAETSRLDEN